MKKINVLTGEEAAEMLMTWFRVVVPNERMQKFMVRYPTASDWDALIAEHPEPIDSALRSLAALPVDDQAAAVTAWPDHRLAAFTARVADVRRAWTALGAKAPLMGFPRNALTVDEFMRLVIHAWLVSPEHESGTQWRKE